MSFSTLVSFSGLVSSAAVLVSLVYLALQVRQSARNQRSIMDRGRSQQVGEWLQFIAEQPGLSEIVMRGHAADASLTRLECQRYLWAVYPLFLHFEDSYYQHRHNMIGTEQYASIDRHLHGQCHAPGFRLLWSRIRPRFPETFRAHVDGVIGATEAAPPDEDWTQVWRDEAARLHRQ